MTIHRRFTKNADVRLIQRADAAAGGGSSLIGGYASVFYDGTPATEYQIWDGYRERIMPGAFDDVLKTDDVVCLFNHEDSKVLGRNTASTLRLSVDAKGLAYECDAPDVSYANDLLVSLERRDVKGSSFSFLTAEDRITNLEDGTTIIEILKVGRLFDVGPVTIPAYTGTDAELRSLKERVAKIVAATKPTNSSEQTRRALNAILAGDV